MKIFSNNKSLSKYLFVQLAMIGLSGCELNEIDEPSIEVTSSTNVTINSNQINLNGTQNMIFSNNKVYINGKEVDIDTTKGINISYDGNKQLINGKPIKYKNSNQKQIEITLTGKQVKIPLSSLKSVNSSFNIEQKCSPTNESYFMIDEALEPYLDNTRNGTLHLKEGNYDINGTVSVELFTSPLKTLKSESSGNLKISCIDENFFELKNVGVGQVSLINVFVKEMELLNNGVSNISIDGKSINKLTATNYGVGNLNINLPISEGYLKNMGVGNIKAKEIHQVDVVNSGVGNVYVFKSEKTLRSFNSGVGDIEIN